MTSRLLPSVLVAGLSLSFSGTITAATPQSRKAEDPQVAIYSLGTNSCGLWLDAYANRHKEKDVRLLQFDAYLHGFASAYNLYGPDNNRPRSILSTDEYAQHAFLERYCREHPIDHYVKAITALFDELLKRK
jgi:hypothetical protein